MTIQTSLISGIEMLRMFNAEGQIDDITPDHFDAKFILIEVDDQKLVYAPNEHLQGDDVICVVMRNADFTEGKGPMVFHKAFRSFESATRYIMGQSGIYGTRQGARNYAGVSNAGRPYIVSGFNGYQIQFARLEA